jgi:hypothetical protein
MVFIKLEHFTSPTFSIENFDFTINYEGIKPAKSIENDYEVCSIKSRIISSL